MIKRLTARLLPRPVLERRRRDFGGVDSFAFPPGKDVRADIVEKYGFTGALLDIYVENRGPLVHKWHHYIPLYDRYFAAWRGKPVRFLEIGVSKGGSLQMWRKYFGESAIIYGIDIDSACAQYDGKGAQVRIGSQADRSFLEGVVAEMGGIDVVLDDGSHRMEHIRASLEVLFPLLADGGTYMIEDLHCAYWKMFGGGWRAKSNFFAFVGEVIEDMHAWYHRRPRAHGRISQACSGVHVHDSVCVLDKARTFPPVHSEVA